MHVKKYFLKASYKKAFWLYFIAGNAALAVIIRLTRTHIFASEIAPETKQFILIPLAVAFFIYNIYSAIALMATLDNPSVHKIFSRGLPCIYILCSILLLFLFGSSSPFSFILFQFTNL